MVILLIVLVAAMAALALGRWRLGVLMILIAGFTQDAFRKLLPTEPVALVLLAAAFLGLAVVSMVLNEGWPRLRAIPGWRKDLELPIQVLLVLVCLQGAHTLFRFGNPVLAGLGLLAYLAPFPAIVLAHHYAKSTGQLLRFLRYYCYAALATVSGVYLSYLGYDWRVLNQVGPGIQIYARDIVLEPHSGFLRSPEIAAWHAAAATCFLLILGAMSRSTAWRVVIAGVIVFLVGAGALTGRRKMLVEVMVFVTVFAVLLLYKRRGALKVAGLVGAIGLLSSLIYANQVDSQDESATMGVYLERSVPGVSAVFERFELLGLRSVVWAIRRNGILGSGAGTGSQGAQYFGGGAELVGGGAEGGLGKIVAELGLPGLLVMFWMAVALVRRTRTIVAGLSRAEPALVTLAFGLIAFLVANAATFLVATQVFGDPFVLSMLGMSLGFLLAIPRLQSARARVATVAPRTRARLLVRRLGTLNGNLSGQRSV